MDNMNIFNRFRIEPRGVYGSSVKSFLVVYDKEANTYVKKANSTHNAYAKFHNSDEVVDYLIKYWIPMSAKNHI